jgi:hypothetical protein
VICFFVGHHIDQCCFDGLHEVMVTVDSRLCLHVDNLDLVVMFETQTCIDLLHVVADYLRGCSPVSENVDEHLYCHPCCPEREYSFVVWKFRDLVIVNFLFNIFRSATTHASPCHASSVPALSTMRGGTSLSQGTARSHMPVSTIFVLVVRICRIVGRGPSW